MKKSLTVLLVLLLLAQSFFFSFPKVQAQSGWWNSNWKHRRELMFNYTKITANQTDFPVLVYLDSSRINWTAVKDDLSDLRFVVGNQTLVHEVESYVVNDRAWIWVKTNTTTPIFM